MLCIKPDISSIYPRHPIPFPLFFAVLNVQHTIQLVRKDILLELRQQHVLYGILLYVASSVFVIFLSISKTDSNTWNGLYWVLQLFIVVNAIAKSFLQDNRGRQLYYYIISSPVDFIVSKLIYNSLLMILLTLISVGLYSAFLGTPYVSAWRFFGIAFLGGLSISMVFTLLSAIAAKAQQNAGLMAILGFPLILPTLLMLIRLSKYAFGEIFKDGAVLELTLLIAGLNVLVIALSIILFPFLWKD
jgi:heme exporter protein B